MDVIKRTVRKTFWHFQLLELDERKQVRSRSAPAVMNKSANALEDSEISMAERPRHCSAPPVVEVSEPLWSDVAQVHVWKDVEKMVEERPCNGSKFHSRSRGHSSFESRSTYSSSNSPAAALLSETPEPCPVRQHSPFEVQELKQEDASTQREKRPRPSKVRRDTARVLAERMFRAQTDEEREMAEIAFLRETENDVLLYQYARRVLQAKNQSRWAQLT